MMIIKPIHVGAHVGTRVRGGLATTSAIGLMAGPVSLAYGVPYPLAVVIVASTVFMLWLVTVVA